MKTFDILIAGEINPDLILSDPNLEPRFGQVETLVENASLTIGSSSVIMACGSARLGLKVAFIGVVGRDLFGDFMLQAMQDRGIDISAITRDPVYHTGITVILSRVSDRAILTYPGCMSALKADQISDELLQRARHFHVSSYFLLTSLQAGLPSLYRRARCLGLTTSLDTNWDPSENWTGVKELLPLIDIFLPNQNEALSLTGAIDLEQAVEQLRKTVSCVAVKLGSQGGLVQKGHENTRLPALPVEVKDTVGAGDSFDAGFLYGFLNNWDLQHCLALAIACGSLSTQLPGGTAAQPDLVEALAASNKILAQGL
jgi:sugar/nucleoside kinase (ribokinase family)